MSSSASHRSCRDGVGEQIRAQCSIKSGHGVGLYLMGISSCEQQLAG